MQQYLMEQQHKPHVDLAENYPADAEYEIGTVICLGGAKEITQSQQKVKQVCLVLFRKSQDS